MRGWLVVLAMAMAVAVAAAGFYYISASRPPFVPHNQRDQTPYGAVLEVAAALYHPGDVVTFTLRNGGTLDLRGATCSVIVEHLEGGTWRRVSPECQGAGPRLSPGQAWTDRWTATLPDGSPAPPGPYRGHMDVAQGDATLTLIVGFELSQAPAAEA